MNWLLERLLFLATPLLAAAAPRKKAAAKRTAKRSTAIKGRPMGPRGRKPAAARGALKTATREKGGPKAGRRSAKTAEPAPTPKPPPPPPPPAPRPVAPTGRAILLAPINGQYTDSVYPKFRWLSVGGATRYQVVWSEDPSFTTTQSVLSIATEATVPVEKPLRPNNLYYWRVRGGNDAGWGPWSPSAPFRVMEEPTA